MVTVERQNPIVGSAFSMETQALKQAPPAWFTRKRRVHFDRVVSVETARELVENPDRVAHHAFLPFVTFGIERIQWQKCGDGKRRPVPKEPRPVAYAGHLDAHVFAYYAHLLKPLYEQVLVQRNLTEEVLAYRKLDGGKCNIHFAGEVFEKIATMGACEAVALDVSGFFDHLDHRLLKQQWSALLQKDALPADHYAVYRHITRWSGMDRDTCFRRMGVSKGKQREWTGPLGNTRDLRRIRRGFRNERRLIRKNTDGFGIPQGSSISAFLSNLYMLPLDATLKAEADKAGGFYRRYSDDLMLVVPRGGRAAIIKRAEEALAERKLELNADKTHVSEFKPHGDEPLVADRALQYLGFEFDGRRIRLRSATVARAHQRRTRSVRSAARATRAAVRAGGVPELRRTKLYAKHSHLGAGQRTPRRSDGRKPTNFDAYARRASRLLGSAAPVLQVAGFWKRLHIEIAEAEARIRERRR